MKMNGEACRDRPGDKRTKERGYQVARTGLLSFLLVLFVSMKLKQIFGLFSFGFRYYLVEKVLIKP